MNFTKTRLKFLEIFTQEYERLILWSPVLLGLGAYLSISLFDSLNFVKIIFTITLSVFSFIGLYINRDSYTSLIFKACSIFLCGFIFTFFYQKTVKNYTPITGRIFVDVQAKVSDIKKINNKITGKESFILLLSQAILYKAEFTKKEIKRERKITEKYILKNYVNVAGMQEIDLQYLDESKNYQEVKWVQKDGREIYPKPPSKISVFAHNAPQNLGIGDEIFLRVALSPPKQKEFVGDFDFAFDSLAKGIGGAGMASGKIIILKEKDESSYKDFVENLRKKIQEKILQVLPNEEGKVSAALLMGNQNLISKPAMTEIRNSGLAHLISISGLHLSLAAGIFFFTARFLLSLSEYLTLRFDIKKIAALLAIISSYSYLEIAGSPVPAQRSFIAVLLVMLAILFDRKIDALRSVCFAAFVLILVNPYNIFSISFQLSFAAILILTSFNETWQNFLEKFKATPDKPSQNFILQKFTRKKLFLYFIEMILISTIIQFATMPLLIYYFGDVAIYGALSNLIAIPLTSFMTMPLGFASFFLMPFGLEKIVLIPMGITVSWILDIASFVSNLENSHFYLPQMPEFALIMAIFGGLIFCLTKKLKLLGVLIFLASFIPLYFVKTPNLLIDSEGKFFALYDKNNGLVFSKYMRESRKRDLWMRKMNEKTFKYFDAQSQEWQALHDINCDKGKCELKYKGKKILALFTRNEINKICAQHFDIVINLTYKYQIPNCAKQGNIMIENLDLLKSGVHFLYFEKEKIKIVTAR